MPQKKKKTTDVSNLRQRAEEVLKVSSTDNGYPVKFSSDEIKTLIHDLDVHQIELEMQNDELRRSQTELGIERSRYFDFYNIAPVGFFSINDQKLIIECNFTAAKMLGKNRTDIINQPITRFITKEDQDVYYYLYNKQFFKTNVPQGCDLRMLKNDGSALWVHLETIVVQKDDGTLVSRMVISDITERKRMEETLVRTVERLELATRAGGLGIWDWNIQKNELIWNDRMYELYGVNKENFNGAYEAWLAGIHPDDREASDRLSEMARKGERNYETEFRVLWPNGSIRVLKAYGQVIRDSRNTPVRMIGINFDITVQRQTEADLQESEKKYRKIFYEAQVALFCTSISDGKLIDANERYAELAGYSTIEECKANFYPGKAWVDPKSRKNLTKLLAKEGSVRNYEAQIFRGDGAPIWISLSATIYPERGYIEGSIEDITKRKDSYEQLKDINTALDVLLKKRNMDVQDFEDNIFSNYELMIKPFLNKLRNSTSDDNQQNLIEILDTNLKEIVSPFTKKLSISIMNLTSTELQISSMIKQGFSNKEIAQMLYCSKRTIDSHRENIRKKLKLKNKKINLKTFLSNP